MHRRRACFVIGAALFLAGSGAGISPALAQTFQNYRCADGTQFIAGFYEHDNRAYLQIDGASVTLRRRPTLTGARYSARGVTLKITKAGTTVKHARRLLTACELM